MDIDIKCDTGKFKLRVCGIITKDNKILFSKSLINEGYVFPGGHVEIGETTKEAIVREIKEEINLDVNINSLFCIHENVYADKEYGIANEIAYYYILDTKQVLKDEPFNITEIDKGEIKTHDFIFIDIKDLVKMDVRPIAVCELLMKNINSNNNILLSDNR